MKVQGPLQHVTVNLQTEADLLSMLNASADGIARIDRSWTILYLNEKGREMVAAAGDVVGKNQWECFPFMVYEGSPWLHHYNLAMNEGTSSEFTEYHPAPLDLWVRIRVQPFQGGIIAFFRDVTAQKELEHQRDLSAKRLEQVLQATNDGVAYIDRQWIITYLNRRGKEILGASGEILGRNHWEAFPAALEEGTPFVAAYNRAMYEGIGSQFEFNYPEPLNVWFQAICEPAEEGMVVFFRDVTEQKQAQQALIQNEKLAAVGRLASSIAHEINNPLESVTNLLYLAKGTKDAAELRDYLDLAEAELSRASAITNHTLRFHKQATNPAEVACEDLIASVLAVYDSRIKNAHVTLQNRKRAQRSVLCFDGEIRQVLGNLIGNATDAMSPGGGRLLIRSREGHDWRTGQEGLIITVADTGPGMPERTERKIFEAFFTTKGIGGTGLGLWISKEIIERHHGRLAVRSSQRPGKSGTVFTLFLPINAISR